MTPEVKTETLTIKFGKAEDSDHSADASVVATAMEAVNSLVERVHEEYESDKKFLVKTRPFTEGSLEIPLELCLFVAGMTLVEPDFFEKVRGILKLFIDIKKRLAGRSLTIRDSNIIVIEDSTIQASPIIIEMLQPRSEQNQLFTRTFEKADNDKSLTAVSLISSRTSNSIFKVTRDEFGLMKQVVSEEDLSAEQKVTSRETVIIRSVSYDPNLQWHFFWNKHPISAKVLDDNYGNKVAQGDETFANGDKLEVELVRVQKYDAKQETHTDREFTITKVHEHIKRQEETGELFDDK